MTQSSLRTDQPDINPILAVSRCIAPTMRKPAGGPRLVEGIGVEGNVHAGHDREELVSLGSHDGAQIGIHRQHHVLARIQSPLEEQELDRLYLARLRVEARRYLIAQLVLGLLASDGTMSASPGAFRP